MIDIQLINNDTQVRFEKRLWHPTELTLATCYGFTIHIAETDKDSTIIVANIAETHKEAMYEFIKISFKNFSEAYTEGKRRDEVFGRMEASYTNFENQALAMMQEKLPYFSKLYLHQREGIMFSLMHRVNFLAFEMRLGKSVTAASLSRLLGIRRTVIICPAIAKWGWFRDLTNPDLWGFNELYFTMMDSTKSKSFRALQERFVIANFDILNKFGQNIISDDIGHFIIDEAHRVKNRFSDRSKIIQQILDHYPNAKITFLSGTPVANRFNDLFNYFKLGRHPLGESYKKFTDEYTTKTASRGGEKITGAKNIDDLKRKMLNFMLVRKMSDCFDMPEDVISRYTFDLDDYREEYNAIIEEMAKEKNMAALRGHLHSINIITVKAKMKGIIEIIEEIVAAEGKVVVFGSYTEPFKMLQAHFGNRAVTVDGSVNSYDRDRFKREFWENPELQIFFGNYLAAGEALDLSCASDIVHVNFPFTPREIRQAQFRCKHPEKKGHLRIHYTFAKDSIDEHIYDNMILSKERDINALMTDGEQVIEMENIEEILIKKLLNKENLDGIAYDFTKKVATEENPNSHGAPDNEDSQSSGEERVFGQVLGNGVEQPIVEPNLERQVEGEKSREYSPVNEKPQFVVQPGSQSENGPIGQVETGAVRDALPEVQATNDFGPKGQYYIDESIAGMGEAYRKLHESGVSKRAKAREQHPEYPAKGYDSTVGFPKLGGGPTKGPVPQEQVLSPDKETKLSTGPSFEVMAALVDNNEKNGNMFIANPVLDPTATFKVTPVNIVTDEDVEKSWEHVRKTREAIGQKPQVATQQEASKGTLPPPPSFM